MSNFLDKVKELTKHELSFEPKSIWEHKVGGHLDTLIDDDISTKSKDIGEDDWMYHGAGSFMSKFNTEYCKRIVEMWSKEGDTILDPFAGRTRGLVSTLMKRDYIGYEVVKQNIDELNSNYQKLSNTYEMGNMDLRHVSLLNEKAKFGIAEKPIDLVMTCPPYWNLEVYPESDASGTQLSRIKNYLDFLDEYSKILGKATDNLIPGKFLAIVVSNWRSEGRLYDFRTDTANILREKLFLYDEVILEMSPAKRHPLYPQAMAKLKMLKTHEYLMIFRKVTSDSTYEEVENTINFSRPLVSNIHNQDTLFWVNKKDWIEERIKMASNKNASKFFGE